MGDEYQVKLLMDLVILSYFLIILIYASFKVQSIWFIIKFHYALSHSHPINYHSKGKTKTTPLHFCIVFRLGEEHFPNSRYVHLFRCVDLWKPNRFLIEKLIWQVSASCKDFGEKVSDDLRENSSKSHLKLETMTLNLNTGIPMHNETG